ncbi:MAG: ankyrin repeat domain-containing protein [Verrucomicrobia bacterium]|nr:ankyrin repeat domain-containing protein [Verrucomicrobiota bacterium]
MAHRSKNSLIGMWLSLVRAGASPNRLRAMSSCRAWRNCFSSAFFSCLLLGGCSRVPAPSPDKAGNKTRPPAPVASSGIAPSSNARANLDNVSEDEWDILLDGKKAATVKPMEIALIKTNAGKHEFKIMRGQETIDTVQAVLNDFKTTVINPKGLDAYKHLTANYIGLADAMQQMKWGGGGSGISAKDVSGERVIEVDYGLLESLPKSITVSKGGSWERTKLYRKLPASLTPEVAAAVLASNGNAYEADNSTFQKAIQLLAAGDPARFQDVLCRSIEVPRFDAEQVVSQAFKAIENHQLAIPNERIVGWTSCDLKQSSQSAGFNRIKGAVIQLLKQSGESALENQFPKLPEKNQIAVLNSLIHAGRETKLESASLLHRKFLIHFLKNAPQSSSMHLSNLLPTEGVMMDDDLIRELDAYISTLPAEAQKGWNNSFLRAMCNAAEKNPGPLLKEKLLRIVQDEKFPAHDSNAARGEAMVALVRAGEEEKIKDAFRKLPSDARIQVLYRFRTRDGAPVPGILCESLKDDDKDVRRTALDCLRPAALTNHEIYERLKTAIQDEKDEHTRKEMNRLLSLDDNRRFKTEGSSSTASTPSSTVTGSGSIAIEVGSSKSSSPAPASAKGGPASPYDSSAVKGFTMEYIEEKTPSSQAQPTPSSSATSLAAAATKGDAPAVAALLASGAKPDEKDADGWTPLMHAASGGHAAVVSAMLVGKANVNAADPSGWSALMLAIHGGHSAVVQSLLAGGADVNATTQKKTTPLILAAGKGDAGIVKLLLEKNAPVHAKDSDSKTALAYAVSKGHAAVIELLQKAGATE